MHMRVLACLACSLMYVVSTSCGAFAAEILKYEGSLFDDSVDPMNGLPGMSSTTSIAVSPDGKNLYAVSQDDWLLSTFDRDTVTGALSNQQVIANGPAINNGLARPSTVIVSADAKFVYVSATSGALSGITVFQRDLLTGALTYVEVERGVTLGGDSRLVISPDGGHLYATARGVDTLAAFARDATTGALTYLQAFMDGAGGVNGLDEIIDLAISSDGAHVYVMSFLDSALSVFERDTVSGLLTFQSEHFDNSVGFAFLQGAASVRVGPAGNEVYVAAFYEGLSVYDRDPITGALTFRDHPAGGGVGGLQWLAMSADGGRLYSALWVSALDVFARNPVTGDITFLERKIDGTGGVDGIDGLQGMTVSPDGQDVYTGSFYDKALSHFSVACGNGAADAGEECDDANPFGSDCCSEGCTLPTTCLAPAKAQLQIQHGDDPTKDKLKWKWSKGEAFTQAEVGAPATDTELRLCVYDRTGGVARLATELVVPAGVGWIELDPKGAKYIDKTGSASGVQRVQVKTGLAGRTKAQLKAGGTTLASVLSPFDGSTFFDQDPSVSVLMVNSVGACWSSDLLPAGTTRNQVDAFKAKAP